MRVLVVTSEYPTPEFPHSGIFVAREVDFLRRIGVEVDVEHFRGAHKIRNYLAARRRVRARIRTGSYDVVHAHFGQSGLTILPTSVPLVVTFHGSDLQGIVGPRGTYLAAGVVLTRVSRLIARCADRVIVVSQSLGRRLPKGTGYTVLPMGPDLDIFKPGSQDEARRSLGLPDQAKLILFAGSRDVPGKRYELARRVVDICAEEMPIELIVITGLPPSTVATYMRACDALLLTSSHEGAPTMVKESLACGLRVVSVDVGDVRETVEGVEACIVTRDDDPETLSRALKESLASRLTESARARAESYGEDGKAAKIAAIYEELVGASSDPASRRCSR